MYCTGSITDARAKVDELRKSKKTVGFVPTMGALHQGHLSLIECARAEMDVVVVSVFVNPTQFGLGEDLDTYPRQIEKDRDVCEKAGVDLVFEPAASEMYPTGYATYVLQERYTDPFEGEVRTGHFHGVCTVCCKLFNIIRPNIAYFGQKDYQQSVVLRHMVEDLNLNLEIRVCPSVREPDGLAMSSRNRYLSPEERLQATCLHKALSKAEALFAAGERGAQPLISAMEKIIREAKLARVDFLAVVNPDSLREVRRIESEAVVLAAIRLGQTRLLDNTQLLIPKDA